MRWCLISSSSRLHASTSPKDSITSFHLLGIFQKFYLGFCLIALIITANAGILILLTKNCNDNEIKEAKIPDKRIRGFIAHNTVIAVEEDVRRPYLVRTKRSQRKDRECKSTTDKTDFKSFVDNFQRDWEERISKVTQLKEGYVSGC